MTEQERSKKLEGIIWESANLLRGTIDPSKYKDYILLILFIKYISDVNRKEIKKSNEQAKWVPKKQKSSLNIKTENDFYSMIEIRNEDDAAFRVDEMIRNIVEESHEASERLNIRAALANVPEFDSSELGSNIQARNKVVAGMLEAFNISELDFSDKTNSDNLGDTYEYLIARFAADAGKKAGEFYTPSAVSSLIAMLANIEKNMEVYDPTCGSGSLLLKAASEGSKKVFLFGQEKNAQTYTLAVMNIILHKYNLARIRVGDTLIDPKYITENKKVRKFDRVIANPPFSLKTSLIHERIKNDPFERFNYGIPPKIYGDFAFVQHMIASLNDKGRAVIVLPEGPLFRMGAEGKIRESIIKENLIEGVIKLGSNLFYGTPIGACLLIIDKSKTTKDIFMINASEEIEKEKNINVLSKENIEKIYDTYWKKKAVDRFSKLIKYDAIASNDYSLYVSSYIDVSPPPMKVNLKDLKKEILDLNKQIAEKNKIIFNLIDKEELIK